MGVGGEKKPMKEISATMGAGKDEEFEAIIEKVKSVGGEIIKDETAPLYTEVGSQEMEVGYRRVVEFNLSRMDIQLTRNVETHILQGGGHLKHLEELECPRSRIIMKRKPETSNDWQIVDLEDMF
jgi:hypothetical protein